MRRLVTALAAAAATLAAVPGTAAAEDLQVVGLGCGYVWFSDGDPSTRQMEIDGGPITVTGAGAGATVELVCTVQVEAENHDGPDAASVSASGPGVVVLPPTIVTFEATDDQWVVVCGEVRVTTPSGVRTFYWDDFDDRWSDTPDVGCTNFTADPFPPYAEQLDLLVCPVLAALFPPEGDVTLPVLGKVWDCPPYGV